MAEAGKKPLASELVKDLEVNSPVIGTIKDNILAFCQMHGLQMEFAVYFLSMIEMSGGDFMAFAEHPDRFGEIVARVSSDLGCPMHVDFLPKSLVH